MINNINVWNKIYNPKNGKFVSIYSKEGQSIINNYIKYGGGHNGPCALNASTGRCTKSDVWDKNVCYLSKKKNCSKIKDVSNKKNPDKSKKLNIINKTKPKLKLKLKLNPKVKPKLKLKLSKKKCTNRNPLPPCKNGFVEKLTKKGDKCCYKSPKPALRIKTIKGMKKLTKIKISKSDSPGISKKCISGNMGKSIYDVSTNGVLLAKIYDGSKNVEGWWASEKWDGYRAIWDGKEFKSRSGKTFEAPMWFKSIMPPGIAIDGELWLGRGEYESCGILRRNKPKKFSEIHAWEESWKIAEIKFKVFDLLTPSFKDVVFEERMRELKKIVNARNTCMSELGLGDLDNIIEYTKQTKITSSDNVTKIAQAIIAKGGEGIMLRKPLSLYEPKRSSTLLKIKEKNDMECIIVDYKLGSKGSKYQNLLGSFKCALLDNSDITFFASGMNDEIRTNYKTSHPINTVITVTYQSLTKNGKPRHPNYLRIRDDIKESCPLML